MKLALILWAATIYFLDRIVENPVQNAKFKGDERRWTEDHMLEAVMVSSSSPSASGCLRVHLIVCLAVRPGGQVGGRADRRAGRQTDRQTDRQTVQAGQATAGPTFSMHLAP